MIFLLILSMTLSQSTSTTQHLLRGPIICSGCLQSLEPWGDVLGDVPIARKAAGLHQIGDGGGDPTRPLIMATAAVPSSSTSTSSLSSTFHSAAGDVQPGVCACCVSEELDSKHTYMYIWEDCKIIVISRAGSSTHLYASENTKMDLYNNLVDALKRSGVSHFKPV